MTFAWSKWAGAAPSLQELPTLCQLDGCVPVTWWHHGRSLGRLDAVAVPARPGMAPAHHGAALVLALLPGQQCSSALGRATLAPACSRDTQKCGSSCAVRCARLQGRVTHASGTWWWLSPCSGQEAALGCAHGCTMESRAVLPTAGSLPFTAKKFAFLREHGQGGVPYPREHSCAGGAPCSQVPRQHTPVSAPPPPPYILAHAWAQPGLLYPQTLFMWHIYSKDWNN